MSRELPDLAEAGLFCNQMWVDHETGRTHYCYLDRGHAGACICGMCDEGTHEEGK